MDKITNPETNLFLYKCQKDLKTRILGERGDKLRIKDLQKENTEEEAREDGASFVVAFVAQPKDKGKRFLQGPSNLCMDTMEDTLQKGPEQVVTETGREQPELVEAPTEEKLMPSISIAKKEKTHVEDSSAEKVICLSSGHIEIDNMDVEQDTEVVITMSNMQTLPSMLGSSCSQLNFFEVNLSSINGSTISMPTFSVNSLIDTCQFPSCLRTTFLLSLWAFLKRKICLCLVLLHHSPLPPPQVLWTLPHLG